MDLVAEDRGSAIRQNKLDVYMESHEAALRAGRVHNVRVFKTGSESLQQPSSPPPLPPTHSAMMPVNPKNFPAPSPPPPAQEGPFRDVSPSNWGYKHIKKSKERGIVSGDGAGYFYPEDPASRQALITINEKTIEYIFQKLREAGVDIRE